MKENSPAQLSPEIQDRISRMTTLFQEDKIVDNFLNLDKYLQSVTIPKSNTVQVLTQGASLYNLPKTFESRDSTLSTQEFLDRTLSTGMLVLHKGEILYEDYWRGMQPETTHISWSVGKSFVAALVGIAIEEGLIDSESDLVTKYLPEFKGTGYEGVTIKHCLQMSSGVKFDEDYGNPESDIGKFTLHFALNKPLLDYLLTIQPEKEPGTYNHYVSMDTQVLGTILKKVIGDRTLSSYLKEKIWDPIGMEHDAQWLIDETGMEFALGGLNITLRDYTRFGLLMLNKGLYDGQQVIPSEWVEKSLDYGEVHLQPGENPNSSSPFGYGYQWWIPIKPYGGDYFASGIYNQHIYVNPEKELVIVKTSANPNFTQPEDFGKEHYINLFQTIAKSL